MSKVSDDANNQWVLKNYCVSFIDLLGQRNALKGQGLLPICETDESRAEFIKKAKISIGPIIALQQQAEDMIAPLINPNLDSELRSKLSTDQKIVWDSMMSTKVYTQRWSDGIVSYHSLDDDKVLCQMNNVFSLFGLAGSLCLLGLAGKQPLRGAIEIAWGVELHAGELYGPAIARAYELESYIAKYPRIIIGPNASTLVKTYAASSATDVYSQNNRALAEICSEMLLEDSDGNYQLHYLGAAFQQSISKEKHAVLYDQAKTFIKSQIDTHTAQKNDHLLSRYNSLLHYFDSYPPL